MTAITRRRGRPCPLSILFALLAASICTAPIPAAVASDNPPPAVSTMDWSKGALFGRVLDGANGQPLANATVALQDKHGSILAWTKTDTQGNYILAADTLTALRLRPSRRRGFLEKIARGAGQLVMTPIKVAAGVVKQIDPVKTGGAALVSTAVAGPSNITTQVVSNACRAIVGQTTSMARTAAVKTVMGERQATPKEKRETLVPGEVFLAVAAPGYKDLKDKAGAYWMEPPMPASADRKTPATGIRAWLEPVKLATASGDANSVVENCAILLSNGKMEPALAAAGSSVKLSAKLETPGDQPLKVRLFARENKTRTVVELKPQEGAPGLFAADMPLAPNMEAGETTVTLVALRAEPIEVNLKGDKTDPLPAFARGLDDLDPDKTYEFDPRIMASENRIDLTLTVLDPKKATVISQPDCAPSSTPDAPTPTAGSGAPPPAPANPPSA